VVVRDATFCKDCGAPLTPTAWIKPNPGFNPIVAAVLSFIPGLGHLYRGRLARAILWFFGVTFAYGASLGLGILIHVICAANAALAGTIRDDVLATPRIR
jgi:TM2 domain-containing membrane protein YozV